MWFNVSQGVHGAVAIDKVNGNAVLAKAARAADAVKVGLAVRLVVVGQGQVVVHHHRHLLHVNAWGRKG